MGNPLWIEVLLIGHIMGGEERKIEKEPGIEHLDSGVELDHVQMAWSYTLEGGDIVEREILHTDLITLPTYLLGDLFHLGHMKTLILIGVG